MSGILPVWQAVLVVVGVFVVLLLWSVCRVGAEADRRQERD